MANSRSLPLPSFTSAWVQNISMATSTVIGAVFIWIVNDHRAWLDSGTGSTTPSLQGYLKVVKSRILRALFGNKFMDYAELSANSASYLKHNLARRTGSTLRANPDTLPQRQHLVHLDDSQIMQRLHSLPRLLAARYPSLLYVDLSFIEGRPIEALYARHNHPHRAAGPQDKFLGHEIAHVHTTEKSLHVWLAEADARKVVQAGWGEWLPVSSLGMVNPGWTFLYAPISMADVDVIEEIIEAGINQMFGRYVTAQRGSGSLVQSFYH